MTDSTEEMPVIDYAARRADRAADKRAVGFRPRTGLVVVLAVVALLLFAGVFEAITSAGRIHPGVTVAGIKVGGMRQQAARSALETNLSARASRPVAVEYDGKTVELAADELGLTFDYDAVASAAMKIGRSGSAALSLAQRVSAWTGKVDVAPVPQVDEAKYLDAIARVAKVTDVAPVDAKVVIEGTDVKVTDGEDGLALQAPKIRKLLLAAFTDVSTAPVQAPVAVAPQSIDRDAAEAAADVTRQMIGEPVTVTLEKKSWEFSGDEVAKWIDFRTVDSSATGGAILEPFVSSKKASKPVTSRLGTKVGRPAKNASFKTSNGRVSIVPSQDGIGADVEALSAALTESLKDSSASRTVELLTTRTQPKITTEVARKMGIKQRISTFTTTYAASNRPRVNNIHLLGSALDGTLVKPGGTFSFNAAAGERTADKGYQEAPAIVNGKLVPQLGGGVCQVGTTVFNAVFESGLPVIERRNHSFYISHYPTGRDATVSWGGPDLKFRNDTEKWVLVSVSYTSSSITVSLYGTDPGFDVSAEVGEWTRLVPFGIEKVKDPTLAVGSNYVEDAGINGRSITVKRIVKKNGKVVRTDSFPSIYKPKAQIVKVGSKKKGSSDTSKTP